MKQSKAYIIGLTGGIACGKTHIAMALKEHGITILDADAISRSLTAENGEALPEVRRTFGDSVFDGEKLSRRRLGDWIFSHPGDRKKLEGILHPMVISRMEAETEKCGGKIVAWDVPLLFECGMDRQCDEVWCACVPHGEQVRRVMKRDKMSRAQALKRIESQMPLNEKKKKSHHIVNTAVSFRTTHKRVKNLLRDLQRRMNRD